MRQRCPHVSLLLFHRGFILAPVGREANAPSQLDCVAAPSPISTLKCHTVINPCSVFSVCSHVHVQINFVLSQVEISLLVQLIILPGASTWNFVATRFMARFFVEVAVI